MIPDPPLVSANTAEVPFSSLGESHASLIRTRHFRPPTHLGMLGHLGNLTLLRPIGEGGMGCVYLARRDDDGECAVVKVLRPEFSSNVQVRSSFLQEAVLQRQLDHPHILRPLESEASEELAYTVLPYLSGGTLADLVRAEHPLRTDRIIRIAVEVGEALTFAHKRGVLHRDLKPGNVLLDAEGHAVLADFGLARSLVDSATVPQLQSKFVGTVAYASPAAVRGESEDTRSDIYSFGAVLYEMLVGKPPYQGHDRDAVKANILAGPPEPIRSLRPDAPTALVHIVERAMARELEHRYAHMSYVLEDLRRAADGRPLQRLPSHVFDQPRRKLALAIAAFVLAIALPFVLSTFTSMRSSPTTDTATPERTIELSGVYWWSGSKLADLDQLGRANILVPTPERLVCLAGDGVVQSTWPRNGPGDLQGSRVLLMADVEGDSRWECLVGGREGSNVVVSVLNGSLHELRRFTALGAMLPAAQGMVLDSSVNAVCPVSLEMPKGTASSSANGPLSTPSPTLLVAAISSGYAKSSRGIVAWDYATGQVRWRHEIAPCPIALSIADLDGDGQPEIIVGSESPENGHALPDGTDDAHSYIYALDLRGQLRWRREMGGYFSSARPLSPDRVSPKEAGVLAWVRYADDQRRFRGDPEAGEIVRLDRNGRILATFESTGTALRSCGVVDLDGDGQAEVLATDRHGRLHTLDLKLERKALLELAALRSDSVDLHLDQVVDLDADGRAEILLSSSQLRIVRGHNPGLPDAPANIRSRHDCEILVLNSELRLVARYKIASEWSVAQAWSAQAGDLDGDGIMEIIAFADKARVFKYPPRAG